jgi:sugar phosphate isomerase/epimerase
MKILLCCVLSFSLIGSVLAAAAPDFHEHIGIQLWSLRKQFTDTGVAATLDLAKSYGFKEIETYGAPGITRVELAKELKARGMTAVGAHINYDVFKKDPAAAIADAKQMGVKFIIIPMLPHPKGFSEADAHNAAAEFNAWGEQCKAAGIRFGYHSHGIEFTPTAAGNGEVAFDILARETKPELVCFEMDVFWVVHAGQDPVKLLNKFGNRWVALHVKDMRKGAQTGFSTGSAPATDAVAVGTGQIDWPEILRTAKKIGIEYYFVEDETPSATQNIPETLKYLQGLKI